MGHPLGNLRRVETWDTHGISSSTETWDLPRLGTASKLFTSVQQRLFEITRSTKASEPKQTQAIPDLLPFAGALRQDGKPVIPFNLQDYLDLVDTSGRVVRDGKRDALPEQAPKLLTVLGIEPAEWFKTVTQLQARFELFVGAPQRLRQIAEQRGWRWVRGLAAGRRLYARANP